MGIFMDLIQESEISEQSERASSLEARVGALELELRQTRTCLHKLVVLLEKEYGRDIDGDGRVG